VPKAKPSLGKRYGMRAGPKAITRLLGDVRLGELSGPEIQYAVR
jgi:hypothetical protein